MSESELQASGWSPHWAEDISRALASAREASPERRLVVFLAALSAETLRLASLESGGIRPSRGVRSHLPEGCLQIQALRRLRTN